MCIVVRAGVWACLRACPQPMMSSVQFAADPLYRAQEFQTAPADRPLVAHFSANDPATMLAAAKLIEHKVRKRERKEGFGERES